MLRSGFEPTFLLWVFVLRIQRDRPEPRRSLRGGTHLRKQVQNFVVGFFLTILYMENQRLRLAYAR